MNELMTEAQREQRRYALAISGGGFRNYFTGVKRPNPPVLQLG